MTWRSIKDDPPPKDGTVVDLWRDGERLTKYQFRNPQNPDAPGFFAPMICGPCVVRDATHWMPLPEPPA